MSIVGQLKLVPFEGATDARNPLTDSCGGDLHL